MSLGFCGYRNFYASLEFSRYENGWLVSCFTRTSPSGHFQRTEVGYMPRNHPTEFCRVKVIHNVIRRGNQVS